MARDDETIIYTIIKDLKKYNIKRQQLTSNEKFYQDLECQLCNKLFTEPSMVHDIEEDSNVGEELKCPHIFCHSCILKSVEKIGNKCPICRVEILDGDITITKLPSISLRISNLQLKCERCEWQGIIGINGRNYSSHASTCLFRGTKCVDCGEIIRNYFPSTFEKVESKQPTFEKPTFEKVESKQPKESKEKEEKVEKESEKSKCARKQHESKCLMKIIKCIGCEETMMRKDEKEHNKNSCPHSLLSCEFKEFKLPCCQLIILRKDYRQHCSSFASHHLSAMTVARSKDNETIKDLKRKLEVTEKERSELKQKLEEKTKELIIANEPDFSNKFTWHIRDWSPLSCSPTFSASGLLWKVFILTRKNTAGVESVKFVVKPQSQIPDNCTVKLVLVGRHGKTVNYPLMACQHNSKSRESEPEESEIDDDDNGKFTKFNLSIKKKDVDDLINENDNSLDLHVHFSEEK
jgi:hypothetical protein